MAGRRIDWVVLHCTATPLDASVQSIQNYWRNVLKWKSPGYHIVIDRFGNRVQLQDFDKPSNGVAGHNANSIHIATIGGLHTDDRTPFQKTELYFAVKAVLELYPNAKIRGHRDFPGVAKACPRYNAAEWFNSFVPYGN
jgi:N-acetylmuramoyl-L-alanine amidase